MLQSVSTQREKLEKIKNIVSYAHLKYMLAEHIRRLGGFAQLLMCNVIRR